MLLRFFFYFLLIAYNYNFKTLYCKSNHTRKILSAHVMFMQLKKNLKQKSDIFCCYFSVVETNLHENNVFTIK